MSYTVDRVKTHPCSALGESQFYIFLLVELVSVNCFHFNNFKGFLKISTYSETNFYVNFFFDNLTYRIQEIRHTHTQRHTYMQCVASNFSFCIVVWTKLKVSIVLSTILLI